MITTLATLSAVATSAYAWVEAPLGRYAPNLYQPVNVSVGTPPQFMNFMFDSTTSDVVALQNSCPSGRPCPMIYTGPTFNSSASSTYWGVGRNVSINSGQWNFTGVAAWDNFGVKGQDAVEGQGFLLAKDGDSVDIYYTEHVQGVIGLGPGNGAGTGTKSLFQTLAFKHDDPVISLSFPRHNLKVNMTDTNGPSLSGYNATTGVDLLSRATVGSLNRSEYVGEPTWIRADDNEWTIRLDSVRVNGMVAAPADASSATNVTLQFGVSGDWITVLPDMIVTGLYGQIDGANRTQLPIQRLGARNSAGNATVTAYTVPCTTQANVTFTFGGTGFSLRPQDWLIDTGDECVGLILPAASSNSTAVLGTSFLQSVYTAFKFNPPMIGFAELAPQVMPIGTASAFPAPTPK